MTFSRYGIGFFVVLAGALVVTLAGFSAAQAGVTLTENQEAAGGVSWPQTLTWSTYTADYGGSGVAVSSSHRISETFTPDASQAGKLGKFFLRYSNSSLSGDSYNFEIYETSDTTADPLVTGTQVLSVPFTLTEATTATEPVLTISLSGSDQVMLNQGQGYAFELVGTSTGSMNMVRRGGSASTGIRSYDNHSEIYPPGGKDLVLGFSLAPVPEPASLALMGLGGLALLKRRREA